MTTKPCMNFDVIGRATIAPSRDGQFSEAKSQSVCGTGGSRAVSFFFLGRYVRQFTLLYKRYYIFIPYSDRTLHIHLRSQSVKNVQIARVLECLFTGQQDLVSWLPSRRLIVLIRLEFSSLIHWFVARALKRVKQGWTTPSFLADCFLVVLRIRMTPPNCTILICDRRKFSGALYASYPR